MINLATLEDLVRCLTDENYPGHRGWPATVEQALVRWVSVLDFATVPMLPVSTTHGPARQAARAVALGPALLVLPLAWAAYCQVLASGMTGFVALPPPLPLNLASVSALGLSGGSAADCATEMARVTGAWLRTGTAVPVGGGALIHWN